MHCYALQYGCKIIFGITNCSLTPFHTIVSLGQIMLYFVIHNSSEKRNTYGKSHEITVQIPHINHAQKCARVQIKAEQEKYSMYSMIGRFLLMPKLCDPATCLSLFYCRKENYSTKAEANNINTVYE